MPKVAHYGPSVVVLLTAAVVLVAGPLAVKSLTFHHTKAKILQASQRLDDNAVLAQINQAYRDIATVVEPSVVHISTEQVIRDRWGKMGRKASSGSGWVFDAQGHIVTNHHVIEGAVRIEVQLFDGTTEDAEIVGADPSTDIAVLKIPASTLHPATRRDTVAEPVRQGDLVFAFGSPFDFRFSMSKGVVSGKGRSVGVIRDDFGRRFGYENFIQVDAAINPGNSGGPLTDYRGEVIAMNTAIATGRRGSIDEGQFAGIGLAIPMEMILPAVTQIIENDGVVTKGYLGVTVVDPSYQVRDELRELRLDGYGLMVSDLPLDHPAQAAGLRLNDVILEVNGTRIVDRSEYEEALSKAGMDNVTLEVWRFDDETDRHARHELTLSSLLAGDTDGLGLLQANDSIGDAMERLGYEGRGVRVARVDPRGPARAGGLQRLDVITEVDGRAVDSVDQLRSVISSVLPGSDVDVMIWRYDPLRADGERLNLEIELAQLTSLVSSGRLPADQSLDEIEELGIGEMITSTPTIATDAGMEFLPGVLLKSLLPGSTLAEALPDGGIIVEVGDHTVHSTEEFLRMLRGYDLRERWGVPITVIEPDGTINKDLRLKWE